MTDVINFPYTSTKEWRDAYNLMREVLLKKGLTNEQALEFITIFQPIYESFKFETQIQIPNLDPSTQAILDRNINTFEIAIQHHIAKLISERFSREIDIYKSTI